MPDGEKLKGVYISRWGVLYLHRQGFEQNNPVIHTITVGYPSTSGWGWGWGCVPPRKHLSCLYSPCPAPLPIPTALFQQPLNLTQVAISQLPPLYYTSDFQGDPPNSSCEDSEGSLISVPSTLSHFLLNTVTDMMILMSARAHAGLPLRRPLASSQKPHTLPSFPEDLSHLPSATLGRLLFPDFLTYLDLPTALSPRQMIFTFSWVSYFSWSSSQCLLLSPAIGSGRQTSASPGVSSPSGKADKSLPLEVRTRLS